jgi:hypothetical protein
MGRRLAGRDGSHAELTIALAGHPRPLLVGPGEEASPVGTPGTVLGMVDPITVGETEVELREGRPCSCLPTVCPRPPGRSPLPPSHCND